MLSGDKGQSVGVRVIDVDVYRALADFMDGGKRGDSLCVTTQITLLSLVFAVAAGIAFCIPNGLGLVMGG